MKGALLALLVPASAWSAPKRVAIIPLNNSDAVYATAAAAVQMELQKTDGVPAHSIVVEDAHGKQESVAAIMEKLQKTGPVDVWVPVGTPAALEVAKRVKDKPIVFGMVFDPVGAGLAATRRSSGNNITGGSNLVDVGGFVEGLAMRGMKIETVEILYTPGERNTELQADALAASQKAGGFKLKRVAIRGEADLDAWENGLAGRAGRAGLVYLSGSSLLNLHMGRVIAAATAAGVPTATHIQDRIEQGCLLGLVMDSAEVGQLTGKALIRVLKGEAPSAIPILSPLPRLAINRKTLKDSGIMLPRAVLDWAGGRP